MKKLKSLFPMFFTKDKLLIIFIILMLMNICVYVAFQGSIYSYDGYIETYPQTGLEFFYYLHTIGMTPFLFIILMLLLPNLISYDVLNLHQSHACYLIETRLSKKRYYQRIYIINIMITFLTIFLLEILLLGIIHLFYAPIQFHTTIYPEFYYCKTQILSSIEPLSLFAFVFLTSLGYSIVSSVLFSLQILITNKYIYRCFGVIFGIMLVLTPALIQGYFPIQDATFILQINNLVALGMENVRANPLGLSHIALYLSCFLIYFIVSILLFQYLLKWRSRYD